MAGKIILSADVETRGYMLAMSRLRKDAYPDAVAETLNATAEATTKQQIKNVKKDLIVRTKFTINSMMRRGGPLNTARGKNVDKMFSRTGTFSPYLWLQENDKTVEGIDGPKPIPTLAARTGKNSRKSVRRAYRLNKNASLKPGNFGDTGKQFIGSPGNAGKYGLYERLKGGKLRMLRNLENESVEIKGTNFHSDAIKKYGTQQFMTAQFKKIVNRELKKKRIS